MSTNVFSINHAGAVGPLDGTFQPPEQQPDSAITDAGAVSNFLEIARYWSHRHMGGVTFYSGADSLGDPFLVVVENDSHKAEIFRRASFDGFEFRTSADGQRRKSWTGHGLGRS